MKRTPANIIPSKTVRLFRSIAGGFAPPPLTTVSEWADENRLLRSSTSAEPGPWRTDRVPYMREVMDCLSASSPVQDVALMKGAQLAGSESGNNWVGYVIDQEPGPTMMIQPTVDLAKKYSQQRIAPLIADSPKLADKVKDPRTRESGNTILTKEFPGGILVLTGANSAAGLRSMPVRNLFMDEVDAYPSDVEGEGDPVDLAMARTRTFSRRKVLKVSTPTVRGTSRIEKEYLESDQRRYFVPCPECGFMHTLDWEHFIIPIDEQGNKSTQNAYMVCPECGSIIKELAKSYMLMHGEWRETAPENSNPKRRGYHISSLYSPLGWFSWAEIAEQWIKAQSDVTRLKSFINTILGESFEEGGETLDYEKLYETHREAYPADLPDDVLLLTAAVDVQDDRLEYECVGWGVGKSSWGIEYGAFYGDPGQQDVWNQLDAWLVKQWSYRDGVRLGISCACIDSGGHFTTEVYRFCKEREQRKVFAIKGRGGAGLPLVGRASRSNRIGVPLFSLGVDTGKEMVIARIKIDEPERQGYSHYPAHENGDSIKGYDKAYFRALTSERRTLKYSKGKPRYVWEKKSGMRNEALDIRNYATAALEILNPNFELLEQMVRGKETQGTLAPVIRRQRRVLSNGII